MPTAPPDYFIADLQRFNDALRDAGAVLPPAPEDGFVGIDPCAAPPELLEAYTSLLAIGYANGWLTTTQGS